MSVMSTMSRMIPVLTALILAGCDSRGGSGGGSGVSADHGALVGNLAAGVTPEDAALLRSRAAATLAQVLREPASAVYSNLRSGSAGTVCGEVADGGESELHPFVVTPEGVAIVSASPTLRLENAIDPFPDYYLQYCATPEELAQLAARMNGLEQALPPPLPELPPPPVDIADDPVDEAPAPAQPRQPRGGDDQSFFNAIVRSPPEPSRR
jgi:hypothetical protein